MDSCLSFLEWRLTGEDGPEAAVGKEKIRHPTFSSQLLRDSSAAFPFRRHRPTLSSHGNDYRSI